MFQTVREVNADASVWGDELLAGGFGFAGALHTGFSDANGGGPPSPRHVVVEMAEDLLVGVFVPERAAPGGASAEPLAAAPADAYLFVVSKRVSGRLAALPPRNVSLLLHPAVGRAAVVPPGRQGARGFDELRQRHGVTPPKPGPRRAHSASVERAGQVLRVTVELVCELISRPRAHCPLLSHPLPRNRWAAAAASCASGRRRARRLS